jgi:hypothetical protein
VFPPFDRVVLENAPGRPARTYGQSPGVDPQELQIITPMLCRAGRTGAPSDLNWDVKVRWRRAGQDEESTPASNPRVTQV